MDNRALDIIEMLYNMIAEAWSVPLGDRCIVERDKALGLLDDLKAVLPGELGEARRLMVARDDFVASARQEAETIRRTAREEADQLVEEQAVLAAAREKAAEIIREAEQKSKAAREAISGYLDENLRKTEEAVAASLESIRTTRSQIRGTVVAPPEGRADISLEDIEEDDLLER